MCGGGGFAYGGRGVDIPDVAHLGVYGIAGYDTQSGFSLGFIAEGGSYISGGYEKAYNFGSRGWSSEGMAFAAESAGVFGTSAGSVGVYGGGDVGGGAYLNLAYKGGCP